MNVQVFTSSKPFSGREQWEVLKIGLERFVGEDSIICKIDEGKKLRIKFGVDPTRPDLTFGHLVVFNKLKQFQDLGHEVILLIGDYTVQIGDPSGRSVTRPMLTPEEAEKNAATYLEQAFKILDKGKTTVCRNSQWFNSLGCNGLLQIARVVTVAQMLEREDFSNRYQSQTPISLVEFMYPLLQGHDSVVLKSDVEIGGSDQLFNMLMGRQLQREAGQPEQAVLCLPLLVGLDGHKKMSKSYGNYIAFNDQPQEMFGKLMSIPDEIMWDYFRLLLSETDTQIEARKTQHPMQIKKELAKKLVERFYNSEIALQALQHFETVFSQKSVPDNIPSFALSSFKTNTLIDIVVETALLPTSKKELKRLFAQGGVEVNGEKINDAFFALNPGKEFIIRVGKRTFFSVK